MSRDFKNFTVSNARNQDIEKFKAIQGKMPNRHAYEAFAHILSYYGQVQVPQVEQPSEELSLLREKLAEASHLLQEAEKEKQALADNFMKQVQDLQAEQSQKISSLTEQAEAAKLKDPAFIFTPDMDLHARMRRVILYLIKEGKLNRSASDLPQQLTEKALNYLIKNEYSHIL